MGFIGKAIRATAAAVWLSASASIGAASLTDHSPVDCLAEGQQLPIYRMQTAYAYQEDDPATPEDEREYIENEFNSSAVIIRPGYVLTAQHSVDGPYDSITVHTPLGDREAVRIAQDPVNDMALLVMNTEGLQTLPISRKPLDPGDRIWNIGYPGYPHRVSYGGTLMGITLEHLEVSAPAFPGMSGGGIVGCENGKPVLVGLIESFNYRLSSYSRVITKQQTVISKTLVNLGTSNGPSGVMLGWFVDFAIQTREQEQE